MIQINDNDQPIEVVQKLVTGTKIVTLNSVQRALRGMLSNGNSDECELEMFSLDEIKEIIDYLTVYYKAHKESEVE